MKTFTLTSFVFTILIIATFTSCQKSIDVKATSATAEQRDNLRARNNCFITHTQDDLFGDVFDFFYNENDRLDSISVNGTIIRLTYDKWGRLIKASSDNFWLDFKYRAFELFPVAFYQYHPVLGGLTTIISFRYNPLGQITDILTNSFFAPDYSNTQHFTYNKSGNVLKVGIKGYKGGTVFNPGFTEFTAAKYDNKLNLLAGNPWIRYILLITDYGGMPFSFMSNSINNASSYKWIYDNGGNSYSVTSTFNYNAQGFPNTITTNWYDDVAGADFGIFTRTSSTSCDEAAAAVALPSPGLPLLQKKFAASKRGLPFVAGRQH